MSQYQQQDSKYEIRDTVLDHNLSAYLPELREFESTAELEASPLYARLRPDIETVLEGILHEGEQQSNASSPRTSIRATAWNLERGLHLEGILRILEEHPRIQESDLFLLTELDYGMARTGNRFVAKEIASALGLQYAFAPCYLSLGKGSGVEQLTRGENEQALHGNALFSRYPIQDAHTISLPNGKDKMKGKEKRLGCQRAVVGTVDHPLGRFRAISLHLDAHSTRRHRFRQMNCVLDHLEGLTPALPVLIGGDWNTSTYNSSRALFSILGYWRRVLMGVGYVIRNHYPYPDRWFERRLFRQLERRGFRYRDLNEPGACTLHYDVRDLVSNSGLAEWIPGWCFRFINWSLEGHDGRCSFKLDWFAGKGIRPVAESPPGVISGLNEAYGRVSDHDPILLDFIPEE